MEPSYLHGGRFDLFPPYRSHGPEVHTAGFTDIRDSGYHFYDICSEMRRFHVGMVDRTVVILMCGLSTRDNFMCQYIHVPLLHSRVPELKCTSFKLFVWRRVLHLAPLATGWGATI